MKLNCKDCRNLFTRNLDRDIDQSQRLFFYEHLGGCRECEQGWQDFKNTVQLLQELPSLSAPPGFLSEIQAKLETPGLRQKIMSWLSSRHRLAYSTVFATMAIGFITAGLLHLPPFGTQQSSLENPGLTSLAQINDPSDSSKRQTQLAAASTNDKAKNFYPGIPPLSEYESTDHLSGQSPFFLVQSSRREPEGNFMNFVSTGSHNRSSSSSILPDISSYNSQIARMRQLEGQRITPDITITIRAHQQESDLLQHLICCKKWQSRMIRDNILLLTVSPDHLDLLRQTLQQQQTSYSPSYASNTRPGSPKKMLMVAVHLQ
ncbi:MAG: hypothetical protein U9R66_12445 [Thermodesulfobacteriota bacterium]|nr:hypothetical protein [Thermodesulfobacteriota bacterium]